MNHALFKLPESVLNMKAEDFVKLSNVEKYNHEFEMPEEGISSCLEAMSNVANLFKVEMEGAAKEEEKKMGAEISQVKIEAEDKEVQCRFSMHKKSAGC